MVRAAIVNVINKVAALVSDQGELIVRNYDYDDVAHQELAETNTAYNFYAPKANQNFIITGIILSADQQVSNTTGASVVIYEATSELITTVDKTLYETDMVRNDRDVVIGLRIRVNEGKFINGKTTDDDIHATITGYYIPA